MVSDAEHIEALRKRLLERRRQQELQLAETAELIRVLGEAPKILAGGTIIERPQEEDKKTGTPVNKGLRKHVESYLAALPLGELVNRADMIKSLRADYGVQGKDSSLYAYISSMLKKIAQDKDNIVSLRYKEGEGFFRERDKIDRNDSELVSQA